MITKVVKIGNSKGIRIPKSMLNESGLKKEVELELKENNIIIKPIRKVRENWEDKFKEMAKQKDDELFDDHSLNDQTSWDNEEWEW